MLAFVPAAASQEPHRRELFRMPRAIPHRSPSSPRRISLASVETLPRMAVLLSLMAALFGTPAISAALTTPQDSTQSPSGTQPAAQPKTHPAPTFHQAHNHLHP